MTFWRVAFAAAIAATFAIALVPSSGGEGWFWQSDKLQHALAFGVLWWLGARARLGPWWLLALLLLAFGGAIEIAQSFSATRQASLGDLAADVAGMLLGRWAERGPRASARVPEEDRGQVGRE